MIVEKILVVDDEPAIRKSLEEFLRYKRYSVKSATCLEDAEKLLQRDNFDVMLLDVNLPDGEGTVLLERLNALPERPLVVMMSGVGTIEMAVNCMRSGAHDFLIKPLSLPQIDILLKKAESFQQVMRVNAYLNAQFTDSSDLIGESPAMQTLRTLLRKVAPTEATVLIQGENGTGKELVAREIYHHSGRAKAPYIKVNCAALSETLIESELFGHEKGSFTGATERREGRFELAHGGTLLLDEISEISPKLQAKLLRVLQEREFERVGGTKNIQVDVRVLATTNRDLTAAVAKGDFREDLFYRLNVFPIAVPPLRERREDVPLIANYLLERFSSRHGIRIPGFSEEALERLLAHSWPGNVRELQNAVERAVILSEIGVAVQAQALALPDSAAPVGSLVALARASAAPGSVASAGAGSSPIKPLHELEKDQILRALEFTGGNRTKASELLGISVRTLRNKLHEYKLEDAGTAETPTE